MFKLFGKKKPQPPGPDERILKLLALFEVENDRITEMYNSFEKYKAAEIRLFTMSAISLFIQAYGDLQEEYIKSIVSKFIEQAIAIMLINMPKAEYSMLHNIFIERFNIYCELIINVNNASSNEEFQHSTFALMSAMDSYIGVQRGGFEIAMAGATLKIPLTQLSINVRDVFIS